MPGHDVVLEDGAEETLRTFAGETGDVQASALSSLKSLEQLPGVGK